MTERQKLAADGLAQTQTGDWIDFSRTSVPRLQERWAALCARLGVSTVATQRWWSDLTARHSESPRRYHTLDHLAELLSYLDSPYGRPITGWERDAVELAIFFHDSIYDPKAGDNEERSAELFLQFASSACTCAATGQTCAVPKQLVDTVHDWIVITKSHDPGQNSTEPLRLFLDFDMAVLSKPLEGYLAYANQIRHEYMHVPHGQFCEGRAAVLRKFCAMPSIYLSHGFARTGVERRARANMAVEIAMLEAGIIPGESSQSRTDAQTT